MELQSQNINEIVASLAKAQEEMSVAVYDSKNPHFKSEYASYTALRKVSQAPLAKNGLAITHLLQETVDKKRLMVTQISHVSGQWFRSMLILPCEKETPQGVGSGISYAKRYTLEALLAIATDDDDGQQAEEEYVKSQAPVKQSLIPEDMADDIEKALNDDPEYRTRILKYYGKPSFAHIEEKHMHIIWKGIREKDKPKSRKQEELVAVL